MKTYIAVNLYDPNISFPVEATTISDAAILALAELGYGIYREDELEEEDMEAIAEEERLKQEQEEQQNDF